MLNLASVEALSQEYERIIRNTKHSALLTLLHPCTCASMSNGMKWRGQGSFRIREIQTLFPTNQDLSPMLLPTALFTVKVHFHFITTVFLRKQWKYIQGKWSDVPPPSGLFFPVFLIDTTVHSYQGYFSGLFHLYSLLNVCICIWILKYILVSFCVSHRPDLNQI